jgi:uncharacterized protein with HEPN domain
LANKVSALKIYGLDYISLKDRKAFEADLVTQDAVVRQLEIIGEATKQVSKDLRLKYPRYSMV